MKIISNFKSLGDVPDTMPPWKLIWIARDADIVILDNGYRYLISLCALKMLLPTRFKLMFVDFNLYAPETVIARIYAVFKSVVLKQVDRFAQLFKDTAGYECYFRIDPKRNRYLPFKVNGWESGLDKYIADPCEGSYVICVGRTYRDHKTFIEAMRLCGLPGVLLVPPGGPEAGYDLPPNLRLEIHSDGKSETFINWIKGAAIVVIPRFANAISPNGISTYLTAMAAHRCVVLTTGPGAEDLLLNGEALFVDPENPGQLGRAINAAWNNDILRRYVATAGRKYAQQLQGEKRYMADILKIAADLCDCSIPSANVNATSSLT
jgi:glycosyltransferase involved in cell wall biosynthesis